MRFLIPSLVFLSTMGACTGPRTVFVDRITVEGVVTVRGNEPFTGVWLETDDRNYYILTLDRGARSGLRTPGRHRATGVVSLDEWNGMLMTFLRVETLEPLVR